MRLQRVASVVILVSLGVQGSSVTSCTEGVKIPIKSACNQYKLCLDGVWRLYSCANSFFDPVKRTCRTDGYKQRSNKDCSTYQSCLPDGQVTHERCGWLQRFDADTQTCQWWFKVDCSQLEECSGMMRRPVIESPREYDECVEGKFEQKRCGDGARFDPERGLCIKSENNLDKCDDDRLEPVTGSCNKYYRCVNGKKTEEKCWFFQRFSKKTLMCEFAWDVDCNPGTECQSGDKKPSDDCTEYYQCEYGYWNKRDCGTSIGLQMYFDIISKDCMIVGSKCADVSCGVEGLKKSLPTDCTKYQVCQGGRFHEQTCGHWKNFDVESGECKYFGVVCSQNH